MFIIATSSGGYRWIEQSLVRLRTDSSRGELDANEAAKPHGFTMVVPIVGPFTRIVWDVRQENLETLRSTTGYAGPPKVT
ncbi:MAG: hypothetical protein WA183_20400 [Chthoniobacterales bacterium]